MKKNLLINLFLAILFTVFLVSGQALAINITNSDFETSNTDLTGWTATGSIVGVWNPSANAEYSGDPDNVAYLNDAGSIYQTLSDALVIDTTYTLSVDVGWRDNATHTQEPGYSIELFAGTTFLGSASESLTQGEFTTVSFDFTATASDPIGDLLKIVLNKETAGKQVNFDNVLLASVAGTTIPDSGTGTNIDTTGGGTNTMANPVPAPILLLGTGLVGLAGFRRRKN